MKVETSLEYMIELDWNKDNLEEAKKFLNDWDKRDDSYYKNMKKFIKDLDKREREHCRNCINFWENKLKNET